MPDRRFGTGMRDSDPPTQPGLVMDDDNEVYLVEPDGTRTLLSALGGSGLPSQWTVDAGGNLLIHPDPSVGDDVNLILKGSGSSTDVLMVERSGTSERTFGLDDAGYVVAGGGSFQPGNAQVQAGGFGKVVDVRQLAIGPNEWQDTFFQIRGGTNDLLLKVDSDGVTTIYGASDFDPAFQVAADGSVHIRTGGSIIADL